MSRGTWYERSCRLLCCAGSLVNAMGKGIPGGYAGRGTPGTDKDTDFCTHCHTHTPTRQTHTRRCGSDTCAHWFYIVYLYIIILFYYFILFYIFVYLFINTSESQQQLEQWPPHRSKNSHHTTDTATDMTGIAGVGWGLDEGCWWIGLKKGGRWAGDGQGSRRDMSQALVCFFFYLNPFLNLLIHIFYISYRLQYTETTHRPHPHYKRKSEGSFFIITAYKTKRDGPTLATNASRWVVLRQQQMVCRPTKTGPNDAFGVVWAISKFFPFFHSCFINTNY